MAKRSKKTGKGGPKSGTRKTRTRGAQAMLPEASPPEAGTTAASTPAPALPATQRGKRERATRGGKATPSAHELLADVSAPVRTPRSASPGAAAPRPAARQPVARQPAASRPKPAPRAKPAPAPVQPLSQSQLYETLAALLVPYARRMESEMHPKIGFCLKARSARTGRETHFGAVQALPDGVAFHLFPLYGHPDLLENVSAELFNRMRGKTCFHFDGLHPDLVAELAELTHAGFERFLADGVF